MKKRLAMALAAGIVFCVAGAVLSQAGGPATRLASRPSSMPADMIDGILVRVEGNQLVINNALRVEGGTKEVVVATDDQTDIKVDFETGKVTDIKPGMRVSAFHSRGSQPAKLLVTASTLGLIGKVVRVEGNNVVVRVDQRGGEPKEVTVATDEKTSIRFLVEGRASHKVSELEDRKADIIVKVIPETGTATKVLVMPASVGSRPATLPASAPSAMPAPNPE